MDHNPRPTNVLDSLGEEIIRIVTPVSVCMFLVVILVSILNNDSSSSSSLSSSITTIATIAYTEDSSDSIWDKFKGALLNSLVFVAVVTVVTFILVLLFYLRCTKFLKYYMGFSAFLVLGFMGGEVALFLIQDYNIPIDCITFVLVLFNSAVVGVLAVFMSKMAILLTQFYLVVIGMLVAYWFTLLPEWTTWMLLVAMALYDLAAVLLPGGPLRLLVELAISRDEDIPALVYEARPVTYGDSVPRGSVIQRRVWRERNNIISEGSENANSVFSSDLIASSGLNSSSTVGTFLATESGRNERNLVHADEEGQVPGDSQLNVPLIEQRINVRTNLQEDVVSRENQRNLVLCEEEQVAGRDSQLTAPLIEHRINVQMNMHEDAVSRENLSLEGIGLASSGAIKLGLGDFIFYSVLVGRAAMYDFMTVYACYLAIVAGLGITLVLLAFYQKALPALPVSVMLGVLFYLLTRLLLETFVVQCSVHLLMF